ncbi:MAG: CARDB domain-containing protein [Thermoplasmatota archaeon]
MPPSPRLLCIILTIILILGLLPSAPVMKAGADDGDGPDLKALSLELKPAQDGFKMALEIKNVGSSDSPSSKAVVLDQVLGGNYSRDPITQFSPGSIGRGETFTKEFVWAPSEGGTHLLWLVVDAERDVRELSERNNLASAMLRMPVVNSVTSVSDGDPDPWTFGEFISGISHDLELSIDFSGQCNFSFIRTYVQIGNGTKEYATNAGDSTFRVSLDVGSLPPGVHDMKVNASYCGVALPSSLYRIVVAPQPEWTLNLTGIERYFDTALNSYVIRGRHDIPELGYVPDLGVQGSGRALNVGTGDGELLFRAYILTDGTATIDVESDLQVSSSTDRTTLTSEDRMFSDDPSGPVETSLESSAMLQLDLSPFMAGSLKEFDDDIAGKIELPFSPGVEGAASLSLEVSIDQELDVRGKLSIDMDGSTTDVLLMDLPGYDSPYIQTKCDIDWDTEHDLAEGAWSSSGGIDVIFDRTIVDYGFVLGDDPLEWDLPVQDYGCDIEKRENGSTARLELMPKEGSISRLLLATTDGETEVYHNNTYMSSPRIAYLQDGSPLAVWSEAGYSEDPSERASSMRIRFRMGQQDGQFIGPPGTIESGGSMDHLPVLAASPARNEAAVAWVRDRDSSMKTWDDREIMVSLWSGSAWSLPRALTDDELMDTSPKIWFSPDGDLWVVWMTMQKTLRFLVRSQEGEWGDIGSLSAPASSSFAEISMGSGIRSTPLLLVVTRGDDGVYSLGSRTGNPSRTSLWDDSTELIEGSYLMGSPNAYTDNSGATTVIWRSHKDPGGDLYGLVIYDGKLTDPLRITSGPRLESGTVHVPLDSGGFLIGGRSMDTLNDVQDGNDTTSIGIMNLSWGADIERVMIDPPYGSTPGSMVQVSVSLIYTGMTRKGMVRTDIYRTYLDRSTGEQKEEYWDSTITEFDRFSHREQVQFTVPVKEYQLGITVYAAAPLGDAPDHMSRSFAGLSAVPDPDIEEMELSHWDLKSGKGKIIVHMKNWGNMPVGSWELSLHSSNHPSPLPFNGSVFEPLFLEDPFTETKLNSTTVYIPPAAELSISMNVTLRAGVNHIRATIDSGSWHPQASSGKPLIVTCLSLPEMSLMTPNELLVPEGNHTFSVRLEPAMAGAEDSNLTDTTGPAPIIYLDLFLAHLNGTVLHNTSITVPGAWNRTAYLNWSLTDGDAGEGDYVLRAFLRYGSGVSSAGIPQQCRSALLSFNLPPSLSIEGMDKGPPAGGKRIDVVLNEEAGDHLDIILVSLYNGYPRDGVVISEALVLIDPASDRIVVSLPENLDEGSYLLSAVVSVPVPAGTGKGYEWRGTDSIVKELKIEEVEEPKPQGREKADMEDITNSLMIALSAIFLVLMVSSFFYQREKDDDEEKD